MGFDHMARWGVLKSRQRQLEKPRPRPITESVTVINHPGFSNPVAIKNEQYHIEGKLENEMRGGWTEGEARQRLIDRGDPDF
jgi:hypothetical protein